jgi:hypothetical protein
MKIKMHNWIKIEDKLPELYEHVLLYDEDERMCVGYRNQFKGFNHHPSIDFATGAPLFGVSHWMPLPEIPIDHLGLPRTVKRSKKVKDEDKAS